MKDHWRSASDRIKLSCEWGNVASWDNLKEAIAPGHIVTNELHLFIRTNDEMLLVIRRDVSEAPAEAFVGNMRGVISCRDKIVSYSARLSSAY